MGVMNFLRVSRHRLLTGGGYRGNDARRKHLSMGIVMAKTDLGEKQICPECGSKFYDLNKDPAHCPKCDHEFTPEAVLPPVPKAPVPEKSKEKDDKATGKTDEDDEDDEEDDEEGEVVPELDDDTVVPLTDAEDDDDDDDDDEDAIDIDADADLDLDDEDDDDVLLDDEEDEDDFEIDDEDEDDV